ncbi:MAG TPA: two-component system response regulator [Chloroflexi bacterium]|nr:two-component system response regulator [Chloroflexota bacterium]HBY06949.1 two-component system response regulator [Chloroflexota bacterium]
MKQEIILIAEDNNVLRLALEEMLSIEGFVVLAAANGIEALSHMDVLTPDLIISDISMPEMDGYAFFEQVRANPDWLSIPFIFLTARGTKDDILTGKDLGAEDYLVKPLNRIELLTAVRSRLERSRQLRVVRLREAYEASLTMLANAIEARDQYTRGHVERVTAYAILLAKQMGWQGKRLEELRFGAILHDIGKIHVRETTLRKNGPLDPEEWEEIRQHPTIGASMVKDIPYLIPAIPAIKYHHERWNGSGYPYGLAGEEIPIIARIVAVADSFDAMTTTRVYQKARTPEKAYNDILKGAKNHFDPVVIAAFKRIWENGEIQKVAI